MMSPIFELVWDCIVQKKQVVARYKGESRVLCPHVLGYKNGKEQCLFYQCGGSSLSSLGPVGSARNWRCIPLDGLDDAVARDGPWHTAQSADSRPSTCVEQVFIQVSDDPNVQPGVGHGQAGGIRVSREPG
jgi:hypothetical protein